MVCVLMDILQPRKSMILGQVKIKSSYVPREGLGAP